MFYWDNFETVFKGAFPTDTQVTGPPLFLEGRVLGSQRQLLSPLQLKLLAVVSSLTRRMLGANSGPLEERAPNVLNY